MACVSRVARKPGPGAGGWSLLLIAIFAFVLLPFVAFGDALESWVISLMRTPGAWATTATVGTGLLAADTLLPIPSSVVLATLGMVLGSLMGTLVGAAGLTVGCAIGYSLGRIAGRAGGRSALEGTDDSARRSIDRYGLTFIVACRAVPVLAEASIIAAGVARVPVLRCMVASTLANLGVAAVYASLGSWAADASMLAAAFVASIAIPGLALAVAALLRRPPRAFARTD